MDGKAPLCGLLLAVLWTSLCGCSMCQSPYDYCSSTAGPDGNPCFCDFGARVNSVFAPPGGAPGMSHGPIPVADVRQPARDGLGEAVDGFEGLQQAVRRGISDGAEDDAEGDAELTVAESDDGTSTR